MVEPNKKEDGKAVVNKLLPHHPHSEDKIGFVLDLIVVSCFIFHRLIATLLD